MKVELLASYSQQSQRYAKVNTNNSDWYLTPNSIVESTYKEYVEFDDGYTYSRTPYNVYKSTIEHISLAYEELIKAGVPKEDARMILPNACFSEIIITDNARAFIEQAEKRLCNKAQWEIRDMFKQMRECIKDVYPTVYKLAVPKCVNEKCLEAKPCGNPFRA